MKRAPTSLALCVLLLASIANAQSSPEKVRAKEAYDRGVEAHARGDFQRAAEEFARADAIAPSNVALQAAVEAAVDADDPALGSELIERSGRTPPTDALAASLESARKKFAGRAGRLKIVCPSASTCLATLDGRPAPVGSPSWARAGQHTVVVQVDGETQTKLVEVRAGQIAEIATTRGAPAPAPAPSPPAQLAAPATSHGLSPVVFWIGAGATVLLGIGAGVMGLVTKNAHDDFLETGCDRVVVAGCAEKKTSGETNELVTNIGLGATAVTGIATLIIGAVFIDWSGGKRTGGVPVVAPVAGGVVGGWSSRF